MEGMKKNEDFWDDCDKWLKKYEVKKMKHMRLLIIIFAILFSCSTYNISANENTDDIVEEKIDVSENINEEIGDEQEDLESISNVVEIDWTVKNGVRKKTKRIL